MFIKIGKQQINPESVCAVYVQEEMSTGIEVVLIRAIDRAVQRLRAGEDRVARVQALLRIEAGGLAHLHPEGVRGCCLFAVAHLRSVVGREGARGRSPRSG